MNTLIPTKEFPLKKRHIIDNLIFDQWERFYIEHSILNDEDINYNLEENTKKHHERYRLLYGKRVYVLQHIIDVDLPFFRGIDRGINTHEIFVEEKDYLIILEEYIEFRIRIMNDIKSRIRRIRKDDNEDTINSMKSKRRVVKKIKEEINTLQELKEKLQQYFKNV